MITPKMAIEAVSKEYPNRKAEAIFDYDDLHFIVSAPLKNVEMDSNGSMFRVNKSTGIVSVLVPMANRKKFLDAIRNKRIEL